MKNIDSPYNKATSEHQNVFSNRGDGSIESLETLVSCNHTVTLSEKLQKLRIFPTDEIQPPPVILSMNNQPVFSIGGISCVSGKAKSRKSFFVVCLIAALIKGKYGSLSGSLPLHKNKIILFDTEQEPYRVQRTLKRICRLVEDENPHNLIVYRLRGETTAERVKLIDWAIKSTPGTGIVFIDGIRDLLFDINSPEQATELVLDTLMPWTDAHGVHICTVLHQNKAKGNTDARGHLGTELINKSECVLSVAKHEVNTETSIVTPEQTRDKEPDSVAFYVDEAGLPVIDENYVCEAGKSREIKDPDSFKESTHDYVLREVFKKIKKPKYTELQNTLILEFKAAGIKIGAQKMRTFIQYYLNKGMLISEGKKPHVFYVINIEKVNLNGTDMHTLF